MKFLQANASDWQLIEPCVTKCTCGKENDQSTGHQGNECGENATGKLVRIGLGIAVPDRKLKANNAQRHNENLSGFGGFDRNKSNSALRNGRKQGTDWWWAAFFQSVLQIQKKKKKDPPNSIWSYVSDDFSISKLDRIRECIFFIAWRHLKPTTALCRTYFSFLICPKKLNRLRETMQLWLSSATF